ncbi:MAG: glycosyltransferase family 4 protein [Verrucomicrobiota bacterium]|nr:glycosyltransferase family 4 protein [Verrucomicrobiota bacterium]
MVLLIGNYLPDQQQSMLRFNQMMLQGLRDCGVEADLIRPPAVLGRIRAFGATAAKWFAYIDKFILFRWRLWRKLAARPALVHICDHSNATYARSARKFPLVVTCHDMLAVRGGLGEDTDCPASFTGRMLQHWILRGLRRADVVACDSRATLEDLKRLVAPKNARPRITLIDIGLSFPYRRLPNDIVDARLREITDLKPKGHFILHVGSNLRRKNREGALRIFAKCAEALDAQMVFAGDPLSDTLRAQGRDLSIEHRIVDVANASNEVLEALYNRAHALLYPSRFEGFGWPIIEAQACGCPVVCSSAGPMADVAGAGALLHAPDDEDGFAADLLRLADPEEHRRWSAKAFENAKRFSVSRMISEYRDLYRSLAPAC